jgi:hypothetical protein
MTIPRLTTSDIDSIENPAVGSIVYDVITNEFKGCTGSSAAGFSFWKVL